jgi:hypothetical protein
MRDTQWAPTAPDGRWVPTLLMVHEHNERAWERVRRSGRVQAGPRRIERDRSRLDWTGAVIALLSFAAGMLAVVAARGLAW